MKTCTQCGAVCEDQAAFCRTCGSALPESQPAAPTYPQPPAYPQDPPYQQAPPTYPGTPPAYPQPPYPPQPYAVYPGVPAAPNARVASLVLGIVGAVLTLLFYSSVFALACSIPGLVMASADLRRGMTNARGYQILNIVVTCLAAVESILIVIILLGLMSLGIAAAL